MDIREEFRGFWRELADPLWLGRERVSDEELLTHFLAVAIAMRLHPSRLFEQLMAHQKDSYDTLMRLAGVIARGGATPGLLEGYQDAQEVWQLREERLDQLSRAITRFRESGRDWEELVPIGVSATVQRAMD